ncbi:SGNH/GDSL hydrolase family protein [Klebsiella michiganensis]|uniref:SGNH/GDSL hydrolase family protein n=1 Tax=Klebsiella michiganensis TaxID=1134687 RepID=UPI001E63330D|nr:GDSL-type esterase/lipase family protein [Klebsiella michiganensis]
MSNLPEQPAWESGIHQLEESDRAKAGPGGVLNIPPTQLANRTRWLKIQVESATDYREYTFYKTESDPEGKIAGIANTPDGKMFRVAQGTESEDSFIYYLNANGVAYPVAAYVGKGYVDNRLVPGLYRASYFPLFHDFNGMVPMWLDEGLPDAAGFGPNLRSKVAAIPNQWAQQYLAQMNFSTRYFPLFHDQNGNVPMWCVDGVPDMPGVGPDLQRFILRLVGNASGGTASADKYFIQGDLYKFIFKRGRMFSGDSVSLNFAFTGDSWTEKNTIPQSLLNVLGGAFKDPGWISCSARTDAVMAGISRAVVSGFSTYDGGSNNVNKPPYGSGPDGNAYYNNNAVGTITWTGITATELSVWYYDGNGVFTITVDDNEPVTITGGGTNASKRYDFSGMSATAHKVVIASTGVGVVCIHGMYGKNSANARGITVSRMGNGGAIASDYTNFNEWIAPVASYIDLDMLFIVIGTNDFRLSKGLVQYKSGIETIISAYKSATPGICICLVSPGHCNATGTPALEEYDKAMRELAIEHNVNLISGYQLFPKAYDNSGGAWEDTLHLSSKGAYILTRSMKDKFFQE